MGIYSHFRARSFYPNREQCKINSLIFMPGCYIPIYMNKISPAQYRAHYYKEVDQIFILPRFSCASSPTISIDSGDCGSIIFLLIKLKIQTRSNDRFGLKLGTVLAQLGHGACPSWATCLPLLGRFAFRHLPNKFIL